MSIDMKDLNKYASFLSDLLGIPVPDIEVDDSLPARMRSYPQEGVIVANPEHLPSRIDMIICLAHEMRHMLQYRALQDKRLRQTLVSDVGAWRKNFKRYDNSHTEGYERQPIELDANAFAFWIALILCGVRIDVKGVSAKTLGRYLQNIVEEYPLDRVYDCLARAGLKPALEKDQVIRLFRP